MYIGIGLQVVILETIHYLQGFLGGGGVVQVNQGLSMNPTGQNGKILAPGLNIKLPERLQSG
jgi:hypothetical protein